MKILQSGFYWATYFKNAQAYVSLCDMCEQTSYKSCRHEMPMNNILVVKLFDVWGIDFIGPFHSSFGNLYIPV